MKFIVLAVLALVSVKAFAVEAMGEQAKTIITELQKLHVVDVNGELTATDVYCAMATTREGTEACYLDVVTKRGPQHVELFDPSKPHNALLQALFSVPGSMPADDPAAHSYRGWSWPSVRCSIEASVCELER